MTWTTLTLQVTTPLFNGGAYDDGKLGPRPADEAGIRVPSIRGAMRFWFRALAGSVIGPDLKLLSRVESQVFGSTDRTSPLILRIVGHPRVVLPSARSNFLSEITDPELDPRWLVYLMGQSLAEVRKDSGPKILRPYVPPGQDIQLKIGFRHHTGDTAQTREAIEVLAFAALWLTCAYGGAGARTRRGFGGLRIAEISGPLPDPWTASTLPSPDLAHYQELSRLWRPGPIDACLAAIDVLAPGANSGWNRIPDYPVLSEEYAPARISGRPYGNWQEALLDAGNLLREFRADVDNTNPRARYRPTIETREWAAVVHGDGSRFQLGALGLPVVYDKKDSVVNLEKATDGHEVLRRASPLWFRPVSDGTTWRLFSFAFQAAFQAKGTQVQLTHRGQRKVLTVTDQDVQDVTRAWIDAMAADDYPERPPTP